MAALAGALAMPAGPTDDVWVTESLSRDTGQIGGPGDTVTLDPATPDAPEPGGPETPVPGEETSQPDSEDQGEGLDEPQDEVVPDHPRHTVPEGEGPDDLPGEPNGFLELLLTDAPTEAEQVWVFFEEIHVHRPGGGWEVFSDVPQEAELLSLQDGLTQSLGLEDLPVGHYSEIRLALAGAQVRVDGELHEATIPSGDSSGFKVKGSFDVEAGKLTVLTLDFDARNSLHFTKGNGWILRPVVKVVSNVVLPLPLPDHPGQLAALADLELSSAVPVMLRMSDTTGAPGFLSGQWNASSIFPEEAALGFFDVHGAAYRMDRTVDSFFATSVGDAGDLGFTPVRLQQTYKGVPVFGAETIVHVDDQRKQPSVLAAYGTFAPGIRLDVVPAITEDDAERVIEEDLRRQFPNLEGLEIEGGEADLFVFNPQLLNSFFVNPDILNPDVLTYVAEVRTTSPDNTWFYVVDAITGDIVQTWDIAPEVHPSRVFNAAGTTGTGNDVLWFLDGVQQQPGTPPGEATLLNSFGSIYYFYLLNEFGIDSINDGGMRLVARHNYPMLNSMGNPTNNACWDCRGDEAVFTPGMVTLDIVAHEFTHGLVEKSGGGLKYQWMSGALNEGFADIFAEYIDCQTSCNWLIGQDRFGNTAASGLLRSAQDPTIYGDPDHLSNILTFSGACDGNNDNCGVHTNSGVPNKVAYLIAAGDTHYGIAVGALGLAKAEQLHYRTLINSGLSNTASFFEYRDVMLLTCQAMIGGATGMTSADCRNVFRAWCSVGLCYLTQNIAGGSSESYDRFGWTLASGNFNGDAYDDLAVGVPYEDYEGVNAGAVYIFRGSSFGLQPTGAEILLQHHASAANEGGDRFGWSLAVGNFNGDAYDDLAVGVPYEDIGGDTDTGVVNIFYGTQYGLLTGSSAWWERLDQTSSGASNEDGDKFGWSLAAGDFNNNGYDDLAVGVPTEDHSGKSNNGRVDVFYGSPAGLLSPSGTASYERIVQSSLGGNEENGDRFGYTLAVGNFNGGAGYDDLAVGVPHEDIGGDTDTGVVFIAYGSSAGLLPASWEWFSQTPLGASNEDHDKFGWSLAVGNFNGGAGYDDLAVGVPYEDLGSDTNTGVVNIVYGSSQGLIRADDTMSWERLDQTSSGVTNEDHDKFGYAVAAGLFNNDAFDDLAVGVPFEDHSGKDNTGRVDVFYGSSAGLIPTSYIRLAANSVGGAVENDQRFGFSLAVGNFDGGSLEELAIGAPEENLPGGRTDTGVVYSAFV